MSEDKPFRVETTIDAPREEVWRALTEPERIRDWFGWEYDGLEGEIRYIFVDHAEQLPDHRIALHADQEIQLEAEGSRTVVRVTRAGGLADAQWADIYDGMEEGWRTFFEQLRFRLERQPARLRRTIYLSGEASPLAVRDTIQSADTQIWHTSRYQHMVVDGDGHLVVVAAQQPLDVADAGPVSVTVSTYGLDDAVFADLQRHWMTRWEAIAHHAQVTV